MKFNFGQVAQAAAKIFAQYEEGTVDTQAPRRFSAQLSQWLGHFSRNAAVNWLPNIADPDLCSFCEEDAVSDCIGCGGPCCMAHAHVSHRADLLCDECVQKVLDAAPKRQRRKRRDQQQSAPRAARPDPRSAEVQEAFRMLGVPSGASWEEVHKAFKAAASATHPDRFSGLQKKQAEERMKDINRAYGLLKTLYESRGT